MAEWKQGYPTGITYTKFIGYRLSPVYLNFCLNLSGRKGADLNENFTYAELGSGYGLSVAAWAAQFPNASFFSVDYNPDQVAWTSELAAKAGLDNLRLYPRPLSKMLAENLPPLDFIVLHGVYSWVSDDVRADILRFIQKFLKDDGCVYISYNALPGWNAMEPARHLIQECMRAMTGQTHRGIIETGFYFLETLREAGAQVFLDMPLAASRLKHWMEQDSSYLLGELMSTGHKAFHFSEMHDLMRAINLHWSGSTDLMYDLHAVRTAALREIVAKAGENRVLGETMADLFFNTSFRMDLFSKQPPNASMKAWDACSTARFALRREYSPLPAQIKYKTSLIDIDPLIFGPLQDVLKTAPASLGALQNATGLSGAAVMEAVCLMAECDWASPAPPEGPLEPALSRVKKFNVALHEMEERRICSGLLTLHGGWIKTDALVYARALAAILEEKPEDFILKAIRQFDWNMELGASKDRSVTQEQLTALLEKHREMLDGFLARNNLPMGNGPT